MKAKYLHQKENFHNRFISEHLVFYKKKRKKKRWMRIFEAE